MKAVYITEFSSDLRLELREVDEPDPPGDDEVIVRVRAAGVNRADLLQARGLYPPPEGYSPNIPGLEFAGEIEELGSHAREWAVGDRVFGITSGEAQAERLKVDQSLLMAIPGDLTFTEAAAVPEAFIAAHDALVALAGLMAGETVVIHAVGSGVGLAALQIAKSMGAYVIGTSRTAEKLAKCTEFGLDVPVYTGDEVDFATEVMESTDGRGADVVLDLVGAAYFEQNLKSLAYEGRLVLVGLTSGAVASFDLGVALRKRLSITGTVLRSRSTAEKAEATRIFEGEVLPLFAEGKIRPNLDRVFDAADVIAAYKYIGSNESLGKVVLKF